MGLPSLARQARGGRLCDLDLVRPPEAHEPRMIAANLTRAVSDSISLALCHPGAISVRSRRALCSASRLNTARTSCDNSLKNQKQYNALL